MQITLSVATEISHLYDECNTANAVNASTSRPAQSDDG